VRAMQKRRPDLVERIILMTGGAFGALADELKALSWPEERLIRKPVSEEILKEKLHASLDRDVDV